MRSGFHYLPDPVGDVAREVALRVAGMGITMTLNHHAEPGDDEEPGDDDSGAAEPEGLAY